MESFSSEVSVSAKQKKILFVQKINTDVLHQITGKMGKAWFSQKQLFLSNQMVGIQIRMTILLKCKKLGQELLFDKLHKKSSVFEWLHMANEQQ